MAYELCVIELSKPVKLSGYRAGVLAVALQELTEYDANFRQLEWSGFLWRNPPAGAREHVVNVLSRHGLQGRVSLETPRKGELTWVEIPRYYRTEHEGRRGVRRAHYQGSTPREVWYVGPRVDCPRQVGCIRAREDGNYNVTFYRPWSRVLDVPGADLEIRSEGLRYFYDAFPGGCKGPIGAVR